MPMISVAEAIRIVQEQTRPLSIERVALSAAAGRVLAAEATADSDLPPFDRAQMDGYAVRSSDLRETPARLRIVGEAAAGRGWHNQLGPGEAVRIMTGAPVPVGADSVAQIEVTREVEGGALVEITRPAPPGRFIIPRGSEIKAGAPVLRVGETVTPAMTAVLAAFGYAEVAVYGRPLVAVLATGTELVAADQQPGPDQIRDSNSYSLAAYAALAGARVQQLPFAGDELDGLKEAIASSAEQADILILSGGVSMGIYDFTKTALRELKAEIFFERVALRPGKPTVFARLRTQRRRTLVFGLPGNPVSVAVTFNLFARTALRAMQGAREAPLPEERAVLGGAVKGAPERMSYLPARLRTDRDGHLIADPLRWAGSSDFVAFARTEALVIVPVGVDIYDAGTGVDVVRLPG